ncbi:DNA cytosine methyltransferase [Bradyrhizobium sp.]
MSNPLAIDLFCGLGGWTDGLLAEGWDVAGFDIEQHIYGEHRYPAQLVVQDVLTLHGSQFRSANLIVASPPCQEYSYMAMPWSLAKAKAAAIRADTTGAELERLNRLFNACFRIQREACEAAGRHIPLLVENVRGAIPWVGRSRWNFGSFHLWGDVPALMPVTFKATKVPGFHFDGNGGSFQTASVDQHIKLGGSWFHGYRQGQGPRNHGSNSKARKAASAKIAKIPLPLSRYIAATFRPQIAEAAE